MPKNNNSSWSGLSKEELERRISTILPPQLLEQLRMDFAKINRNGPGSMSDLAELEQIDLMLHAFKIMYENFNQANHFLMQKRASQKACEQVFYNVCNHSEQQIIKNPNFANLVAINGTDGVQKMVGTMLEVLKANHFKILPESAIQASLMSVLGAGSIRHIDPRNIKPRSRF